MVSARPAEDGPMTFIFSFFVDDDDDDDDDADVVVRTMPLLRVLLLRLGVYIKCRALLGVTGAAPPDPSGRRQKVVVVVVVVVVA